jgi:dihydrofolate reductase
MTSARREIRRSILAAAVASPNEGTQPVIEGELETLMDHALVDEVRLMVHPVILGAGERLFSTAGDRASLRLLDTKPVGDGLAHLAYEVV